ncbi:MAG: DUF2235 domain-containing protein [Geminicoccaceae bacterium]
MSKLLVCCDGTWNDERDETHVWRIATVAKADPDIIDSSRVHYDSGVGTDDPKDTDNGQGVLRWLADWIGGGAFGKGISKNIVEAYEFIVDRYEPGDEIYMIGFSRGAFTVRSLAGLMGQCGLAARNSGPAVCKTAYEAYRYRDDEAMGKDLLKTWNESADGKAARREVPIAFLGVFDTVGALGIPIGILQRGDELLNPRRKVQFHDTRLGKSVLHAAQALAVDEHRGPFVPTLWTGGERFPGQKIRQVWFSGVHSDVGGGYPEKELAGIPLAWMLGEMAEAGLDLRHAIPESGDYRGEMHDSMSAAYKLADLLPPMRSRVRPIGAKRPPDADGKPVAVPGEALNWSIQERILAGPVISGRRKGDYRPVNIQLDDGLHIHGDIGLTTSDRRREGRQAEEIAGQIAGIGFCTFVGSSRTGTRARFSADLPPADQLVASDVRLMADAVELTERMARIVWVARDHRELGLQFV